MKEKGRFLRLFAALFMLTFSANVFAAGYTCEKIYDTCNEGYYLSNNNCVQCTPGCTCAGGTAQPVCCGTQNCPSGYTAGGTTYNSCTQTPQNACYKNCTKTCSGNNTSACPANSVCTYNTSYTTTGIQYVDGACNAATSTCPLSGFTCNAGYEKNSAGTACNKCSDNNTTEEENITNGKRSRSVTYNSTAGSACTATYGNWTYNCNSGYYFDGTSSCVSCTTVACDSRSGTEDCTCTCSVDNGSCTCSGGQQSYTDSCKRTGGAGGSNGASACTGTNYTRETTGTCTGTNSITCNKNYYLNGSSCNSCATATGNRFTLTAISGQTSITACYRNCTTSDITGSATVTGVVYSNSAGTGQSSNTCEATSCDSNHCLQSDGSCIQIPNNGSCSGDPNNPLQCNTGYTLSGTTCNPNTYDVTYSCGEGSGTPPAKGSATYDSNFTPASGSGCTKTNYDFAGWTVSGTSPAEVKSANVAFTWKYTSNKTFTAKFVPNSGACTAGQYFDSATTSCQTCPSGYTSDAGADGMNECYQLCNATCKDPGFTITNVYHNNSTNQDEYWLDSVVVQNGGRQYYGTSVCQSTTLCNYTDIMCRSNHYLNPAIWTCDSTGCTAAPTASTATNACLPCSDGYPNSDGASLYIGQSMFGDRLIGQGVCYTNHAPQQCTERLPKPTNAASCTYKNHNGSTITSVNVKAYWPNGELLPTMGTVLDENSNDIHVPTGCYMQNCTCNAGYVYTAPTGQYDDTDPGACVPGIYTITLNDNGGSGGSGTIYQKYSVGWYSNAAATTAITSVTKPTLDENHSFTGYYDAQTGGNQKIPATGVLPSATTFTENTPLYAQWSEDSFTCTAGKRSNGAKCRDGYYCPGGSVPATLKDDTTSGCERVCPTDTGGGTVTSYVGDSNDAATAITQCKTTRTNVTLTDGTGAGDQTCYYNNAANKLDYSKDCTTIIKSCVAGRYRESETSITCAVVGRGKYSPNGDIDRYSCSALTGADSTVTTETDTSAAATACYNVCSNINIENGSRVTTNEKEYYNGTRIPACTYTTTCNTGYGASGQTCTPNVYTITLNHNGGASSTSTIYLKYNTGWYSNAAATTAITNVALPTLAGQSCSGYFSPSNQQVIDSTGKLTTQYTMFAADATITASWEQKPIVNCAAGTYYTGTGTTCTDCPAGSYCGGTNAIQDIGVVSGIESCPTDPSTYTAASSSMFQVSISSATKSKVISDCYAANVKYTATQGGGRQTCYYNAASDKYIDSCKDKSIFYCSTGHWLATSTATDCVEVTAGYYSPDNDVTRKACPNRATDSTITTQSTTAGAVTQCYRGNIWYEPTGGHSGHRRNCYHNPDETDTNIDTGYTYNCDLSVIVTCDAGYYDDGSYKNSNNERDCKAVGTGYYSPAQSACSGEDLQPNMSSPGCSTQRTACPSGAGVADVISTIPTTATTTSASAAACVLSCKPTKDLNGTTANVINPSVYYNTTKNAYDICRYDSNVCPEDMWCDEDGFYDCPNDKDGRPGQADVVANQKYRDITTCYILYNPWPSTFSPAYQATRTPWGHGTGWVKAFYAGTATNGDYTNYYNLGALTCDAGYYYNAAMTCSDVATCYYSPAQSAFSGETPTMTNPGSSTQAFACPDGCSSSDVNASSYTQCYKSCDATTANFAHSKTVAYVNAKVNAASATSYNACQYNITCTTGYDVQNNGTATPSCKAHTYNITLNKNGGTGATPSSVQCTFDSGTCELPAIVDTRTGYSTASKWCTAADGSGTCYNAGTNVTTNISANATNTILYAQWTPNVYTITLNHNGAATTGTPGTVYLKYATGWYSNANATTAITQLTRKPVKGVLTFAGYKSANDVIAIDSDGKFVITESALTFTSTNATITAQWTDAPITCAAGKYYAGTGEDPATACVVCTENNYCPGVTVVTNSGPAGLNACPDGGKSPTGSAASSACYKELLPTYVATHGKGTQTCYYDETPRTYSANCKDFAITTCDGGYYLVSATNTDCTAVGIGYYSPDLQLTRNQCPNGGTTNGTTKTNIQDCFKTGLDYTATDGSGTGTQSCWYSDGSGTSAVYGRDCFDKVITACRGGYYLANNTDIVCSEVDYNYYSNEGDIARHSCPDTGKTRTQTTVTVELCYEDGLDYVAEHGGGSQTCFWNIAASAYNIGCGDKTITYCDGGYYLANPQALDCVMVGYAAYSPNRDLLRHACPAGMTTQTQTSISIADCFECPAGSVCEPGVEPKTCAALTNNQYTLSDAGTSDVADCYRLCDSAQNATTMSGRDYYDGRNTCVIVACEQGYALQSGQCVLCPEGSYCGGEPGDDGEQKCSDLGDGSWAYSNAGATNPSDCYRTCLAHDEGDCALVPVETKAYWPNNCEYTATINGNPAEYDNGVCVVTGCLNYYEMINGSCEPCDRDKALSYKPEGNCIVESCQIGYHPNNDACEEDTIECTDKAPHATYAEQTWVPSREAYGICTIKSCETGYHLSSNACVENEQICSIPNGTGTRTWNTATNMWNQCVATSCVPGYTNDPYEKNNASEQCSECRNKFSVLGEIAVSSYISGCEIASCMYQGEKYNLDNNECVPICKDGYSDETGRLHWNNTTKKCERICNTSQGYIPW